MVLNHCVDLGSAIILLLCKILCGGLFSARSDYVTSLGAFFQVSIIVIATNYTSTIIGHLLRFYCLEANGVELFGHEFCREFGLN